MRRPNAACLLCGAEDQETRVQLVEWFNPQAGHPFDHLPRCVDRPGCRARVEAAGQRWEVNDGTPSLPIQAEPVAGAREVDAEPMGPPADVAADEHWFSEVTG